MSNEQPEPQRCYHYYQLDPFWYDGIMQPMLPVTLEATCRKCGGSTRFIARLAQDAAPTEAQEGEWHTVWGGEWEFCCCADRMRHDRVHSRDATAAVLNALTADLKAARKERDEEKRLHELNLNRAGMWAARAGLSEARVTALEAKAALADEVHEPIDEVTVLDHIVADHNARLASADADQDTGSRWSVRDRRIYVGEELHHLEGAVAKLNTYEAALNTLTARVCEAEQRSEVWRDWQKLLEQERFRHEQTQVELAVERARAEAAEAKLAVLVTALERLSEGRVQEMANGSHICLTCMMQTYHEKDGVIEHEKECPVKIATEALRQAQEGVQGE